MKRYLSLDVLRGLTVAFMCIVNNPGSWGHVFPPLLHAKWTGCTPTDLVYPFFLFCAGCAMAFSFAKFEGLEPGAVKKIIRRGLLIFVVGLLCNMFPFFPMSPHDANASFGENWIYWIGHVRIFGVLQRIGLAYMIAGLVAMWLRCPKKILAAIGVLSVVYTLILLVFGSEPGAFTLEGNISGKIDLALVGDNHVYHGYRDAAGNAYPFDPEGLLGALMGACTALLGFIVGTTIRQAKTSPTSKVLVWGMLSLAFSQILSIWIPISKPLWSVSYVFLAGGWAMAVLGVLMYFIDDKGVTRPFTMFKIMGTNALTAFVMSAVISKVFRMLGVSPSNMFNIGDVNFFGFNEFTSLAWALIFMMIIFSIQYALYRKKIIIKL